jgi:hypothetical protein
MRKTWDGKSLTLAVARARVQKTAAFALVHVHDPFLRGNTRTSTFGRARHRELAHRPPHR